MAEFQPENPLDIILRSLLRSPQFEQLTEKNWEALARLIPGVSAKKCCERYEELARQSLGSYGSLKYQSSSSRTATAPCDADGGKSIPDSKLLKPPSDNGIAKEKRLTTILDSQALPSDQGPMMVIHVCDESKGLKQDFHCARDVLVQEMRYFAEYLSSDAHRLEDVDISVHCDIAIFDWLIKYVKRNTSDAPAQPVALDPYNVVSILISSDFLKMSSLVDECITFCYKNMSAILAAPCNMNCINDNLVTRIAEMFTQSELDDVKDRKDKFKSKLFTKKIEKLFDPSTTNIDSPENASTLFRCAICKKMLTSNLKKKIKCKPSRLTVDNRGHLVYCHVKDKTFDINDYITSLKTEVKYWRDVYWRLWALVNHLQCSRCNETFPCTELTHCRYHPELPQFDDDFDSIPSSLAGVYPCCNASTFRFNPTNENRGCRVRDHIVSLPAGSGDHDDNSKSAHSVYNDLLSHRDVICVPYNHSLLSLDNTEEEMDIFHNEEHIVSSGETVTCHLPDRSAAEETHDKTAPKKFVCLETVKPAPVFQALTVQQEVLYDYDDVGFGESDDELGDDEQPRVRKQWTRKSTVLIDPQAILIDAPGFEQTKKSIWDNQRSLRWNQDAQRQEDQRRMKDIREYLTNLRIDKDKLEKQKPKLYTGGIFSRLDTQWKLANTVVKAPAQTARPRPRFNQTKSSLNF